MQNNYFGGYLTKTFSDFWEDADAFYEEWNDLPVFRGCIGDATFKDGTVIDEEHRIKEIFYLLYAKYGNSHIVNNDETQFKLRLWSTIFQYAPTWSKKLEYQTKIRALTDDELFTGSTNIHNHAYNPATEPSTGTSDTLDYINDQNVSKYKRGKLDAYFQANNYLEQDFTKDFLNRFRDLFIKILEPSEPLIYENEI